MERNLPKMIVIKNTHAEQKIGKNSFYFRCLKTDKNGNQCVGDNCMEGFLIRRRSSRRFFDI